MRVDGIAGIPYLLKVWIDEVNPDYRITNKAVLTGHRERYDWQDFTDMFSVCEEHTLIAQLKGYSTNRVAFGGVMCCPVGVVYLPCILKP